MKTIKLFLVAIYILVLLIYMFTFMILNEPGNNVNGLFIFIPFVSIVIFVMGLLSWKK